MIRDVPANAPARVFVTGATGLLGGHVVRRLLALDSEVVALVRDAERAARLLPADGRLRLTHGDLTRVDSYAADLRGADAVIHTAAYVHESFAPGFDADLLHRTNVVAVRDLLQAAVDAGVPAVVHTSSTSTIGPMGNGALADEDTPPPAMRNRPDYNASKLRAEEVIRDFCEHHDLRVPIVLPAALWGPCDSAPTATGRVFLDVAHGELPAAPRAGYYMVDARDVAGACIRAATDGRALRRYIVAGVRWTMAEVCAQIARTVGARVPRTLPARATLPLAALLELQAKLRRRPPAATRLQARILLERDRVRLSSARAEHELGVSFRPLEETLAEEAAWYREQGML
jgi:nucleoside-diphosphate-sugar epimerase